MNIRRTWGLVACAVSLMAALVACGANSQGGSTTAFKDGDTLTILVGYAPGGGFDTQSRMIQPFLESALKDTTGKSVRVLVKNVPGAESQLSVEKTYSSDPSEHKIVFLSNLVSPPQQVIGNAKFNLQKMTPLGMPTPEGLAIVANSGLSLSKWTLQNLAAKSHQSPLLTGSSLQYTAKLLKLSLADNGVTLKTKPVSYNSTSDIARGLLRGDVQIGIQSTTGISDYVNSNKEQLKWVVNLGCRREPAAPQLETIVQQGVPGAKDICESVGTAARIFMGPPSMKKSTSQAITSALEEAITNKRYAKQSKKAGFLPGFEGPTSVHKLIDSELSLYTKHKSELAR